MKNQEIKYTQGDVVLRLIESLPEGLHELLSPTPKAKILQKSETTGHHHQFKPQAKVKMYTSGIPSYSSNGNAALKERRDVDAIDTLDFTTITPDEGKYVVVGGKGEYLFHGKGFDFKQVSKGAGDHHAQLIPPGTYEVGIVREFNPETTEIRSVLD